MKKFEGKTIGVDAYGWLHRGTVACAMELALNKPTRRYIVQIIGTEPHLINYRFVDFCMHRVRMLQHYGVTPYLIFDGDYLPSKAGTETDRLKRRSESKKAGLELLNAGRKTQAYLEFQKAVDVTPEMARQLIDELKKCNVKYIVAPYEADSQLVYLERKGIIDGILSEDSDLLVFGAKCLLTKLDQYGNCIEVNKADFSACREISLTGWSEREFRRMAILSGCDYLPSIKNMGLKTAYRLIRKHKTVEKILKMLQFDGSLRVPDGYLLAFHQAEFTFLHQRVFCPVLEKLVLHTEPDQPIDLDNMPYLGADVLPEIAKGVAIGDLNPMTKLPIIPITDKIAAPTTPWARSKVHTQVSASSDDIKKSKPMDKYIKKRIPLAELDVNCFTPSPSQQDTLHRNSGPWDASHARPYLSRSRTEPRLPMSAPPPVVNNARTHIRTSTISEPRPPKRARLCDDLELLSPKSGQPTELSRSRFFGSVVDPSPTVGKASRSRRSKKGDITIFSDDSIEEAMLSLPDFDGFGSGKSEGGKRIAIFEEATESKGVKSRGALPAPSPSPLPAAATTLSTSQDSNPGLTPSTSFTSSYDPPSTPSATPTVHPSIFDLKSRFSFAASTPIPISHDQHTPASSINRPSRIPLAIKNPISATKSHPMFTMKPKLTPLQRLGANATNRPKSPMTPPSTPLHTPNILELGGKRRSLLSKGSVPFPEAVDAAMVPLPRKSCSTNHRYFRGIVMSVEMLICVQSQMRQKT